MKHHMKVEELLRLNHFNKEKAKRLKPGDKLRIRLNYFRDMLNAALSSLFYACSSFFHRAFNGIQLPLLPRHWIEVASSTHQSFFKQFSMASWAFSRFFFYWLGFSKSPLFQRRFFTVATFFSDFGFHP